MIELISIDTGESCGIALWNDSICFEVFTVKFKNDYVWQNLQEVIEILRKYISENYPVIAIELPSRELSIQWSLFKDIRTLANNMRCVFHAFVPTMVKKAATGNGRANKEEIKNAILIDDRIKKGLIPNDEHQFDAIAVGICYYQRKGE